MNKFEKCKTCNRYKTCEYLTIGEICSGKGYAATANETICDCFQGKTVDIEICPNDFEVRLDLVVEKKKVSRIWGQVKDTYGYCVENALVILLKPQYVRGEIEYFPVATTVSDSMGFYQFEIDNLEKGLNYRVSVGK